MRHLIGKIDRRLAIAAGVLLASGLLLAVGLVSIFAALGNDPDLPSEGSLQDILNQHDSTGSPLDFDLGTSGAPAAPAPVRMVIPNIGVDASVLTMGLDPQRYPQVPNSGGDVAWYSFTAAPGRGGNAVFSGHVDWYYWGQPGEGVFYHLRELQVGDHITIHLENGNRLTFRVTGAVATAYDDPNVVRVMDNTSKDVITLITCGGTWQRDYSNPQGGNYSHRVIVRAERVYDLAAGPAD